jgi:hypothetical protein
MKKHVVTLVPRTAPPLAIGGVMARGDVVAPLCRRLLQEEDVTLVMLDGVRVIDPALIIVLGPSTHLPWVDGVTYLGAAAPGLWIPTHLELNAPAALVRDALAREVPVVLLPDLRVSLQRALPIARELLAVLGARAA